MTRPTSNLGYRQTDQTILKDTHTRGIVVSVSPLHCGSEGGGKYVIVLDFTGNADGAMFLVRGKRVPVPPEPIEMRVSDCLDGSSVW